MKDLQAIENIHFALEALLYVGNKFYRKDDKSSRGNKIIAEIVKGYSNNDTINKSLKIVENLIRQFNKNQSISFKGEKPMKHLYDETRHNAHETLKEVNKHLSNPKVTRHPKNMAMLMRMKHDAVNTLDKLDRIQRNDYRGDINRDMADAYNMIDRILPHLEEMENRRGVKGTGRYSRRRMEAYNYNRGTNNDYNYNNDNTDYDNDTDYGDMDDDEEAENARRGGWRPRRTRRGVGRFTQVRTHVRRKPGADMDDDYMAEAMARTAAEAAAETAKQMTNTNIYPHTPPVMPQQENRAADMFNANTNDKRAIGVNR